MDHTSMGRTIAGTLVIAGLIAGAAILQSVRETRYPPPPTEDALYLKSGTTARRISLGYTALAADLYWIRAIQYYGGIKLRNDKLASSNAAETSDRYELLYPLLDITTTLDPRFNIAYRFGSTFLAESQPGGAGRPDLAIALLEKGLRERPDKWEYMQDIGFVHYWYRHDFRAAGEWFNKAAGIPEAPWFLRSLAAVTLTQGGDRRLSRIMWQSILQASEVDWQRSDAERRLKQLDAADLVDALQRRIDGTASATGRITTWQGLVQAGVLRGVPTDPTGTPLVLDDNGRVGLSPTSSLYPLPEEPKRTAPTS